MAINMLCPNGHHLVTEDQYAGMKVRCPHCQVMVIVPGAPEVAVRAVPVSPPRSERNEISESDVIADEDVIDDQDIIVDDAVPRPRRRRVREYEEDDYEERPRKKKKKKSTMTRRQMGLTSLGLAFHYARVLTWLIGLALMIFAYFVAMAAGTSRNAADAGALIGLLGVLSLLASLATYFLAPALGITGSTLCCWVPWKTGAKPLIITALALDASGLVLPVLSIIIAGAGASLHGFGAGTGAAALVFLALAFLCVLAGFILFMLFLRQLANFMDDSGSADEAMSIIITWLILLLAAPIGFVVAAVLIAVLGRDFASALFAMCIIGLIMLAAMITWLVFLIKLQFRILNLISSLRQSLRNRYGV
jgi:hypothetical protein